MNNSPEISRKVLPADGDPRIFRFGDCRLDVSEKTLVTNEGKSQSLTARPLSALVFMLERPGKLLTKELLLESVWPNAVVEENSLMQTISWLRRQLGDRATKPRYIQTVSGSGYRFIEAVSVETRSAGERDDERIAVAVLPFQNLSSRSDLNHIGDGIAESILNTLGTTNRLRVIGRASSFAFRGQLSQPKSIALKLGVNYLVTGSVRQHGTKLRINAQVIDPYSGEQIWSERFHGELENLFDIEDRIAAEVAAAAGTAFAVNRAHEVTSDPEAYDLYLRARASARRGGPVGMGRAVELYRLSLNIDSQFALSWLGLAEASRGMLVFATRAVPDARRSLIEAAERAISLAPDFWASHLADAWRCSLVLDWLAYDKALVRAAELAPGAPPELSLARAVFFSQIGQVSKAVEHARRAVRDDPLSLLPSNILQLNLHAAGRDSESELEYQRSVDLPGARDSAEHLALQRAWISGDQRAIDDGFARYMNHQTMVIPELGQVFEAHHDREQALDILRRAADSSSQSATPLTILSWWLAHYGDSEAALAAASRAQLELEGAFPSWLWFPVFADVRRQRKFKDLLEALGLPNYWRSTNDWGEFVRPTVGGDFECIQQPQAG